jgi:uncharacterized protein with NRDE domain
MTKDDFRAYVAAFNAKDFDGFSRYYAENVQLQLGQKRTLNSRQEIVDFYSVVKTQCDERLWIKAIIMDEEGLAAELDTEFKAIANVPDFIAGPLEIGQSIFLTSFVHYTIKDGRFATIKSARSKAPTFGPSTF